MLAPLRTRLNQYQITPQKALGQNFLFHEGTLQRIAHAVKAPHVLEIGPGAGVLTRFLLQKPGIHLQVIEKDARFLPLLQELDAHQADHFQILIGDALELPWQAHSPAAVVGNLPYNISVPLILKYLCHQHIFTEALFMVQREVAHRMMAVPRTKAYGRLSVMVQSQSQIEKVLDVPKAYFWPMPQVESMVVRLRPLVTPALVDRGLFSKLVEYAFQQRRKMIKKSLSSLLDQYGILEKESWLQAHGIDPAWRAEELSVDQFCRLTSALGASQKPHDEKSC